MKNKEVRISHVRTTVKNRTEFISHFPSDLQWTQSRFATKLSAWRSLKADAVMTTELRWTQLLNYWWRSQKRWWSLYRMRVSALVAAWLYWSTVCLKLSKFWKAEEKNGKMKPKSRIKVLTEVEVRLCRGQSCSQWGAIPQECEKAP